MSTIEQIEAAVRQLSTEERAAFRVWFAAFDAEEWDRQFEAEVTSGALDWLAAEARRDRDSGQSTER